MLIAFEKPAHLLHDVVHNHSNSMLIKPSTLRPGRVLSDLIPTAAFTHQHIVHSADLADHPFEFHFHSGRWYNDWRLSFRFRQGNRRGDPNPFFCVLNHTIPTAPTINDGAARFHPTKTDSRCGLTRANRILRGTIKLIQLLEKAQADLLDVTGSAAHLCSRFHAIELYLRAPGIIGR